MVGALHHNSCITTSTVRDRQRTKLRYIRLNGDLRLQLRAATFQQCLRSFPDAYVTHTWPLTIDRSTILPRNNRTATTPKARMVCLLAQLSAMSRNVLDNLRQNQRLYEKYFNQKIRTMPKFSVGQMVCVDRPPLDTLYTESNAEKLNKLLPRADGHLQILQVTEHTLTVDENGVPNTISSDRATPVIRSITQPRHFKVSRASSKDETTLHERDSKRKTGTTSLGSKTSIPRR